MHMPLGDCGAAYAETTHHHAFVREELSAAWLACRQTCVASPLLDRRPARACGVQVMDTSNSDRTSHPAFVARDDTDEEGAQGSERNVVPVQPGPTRKVIPFERKNYTGARFEPEGGPTGTNPPGDGEPGPSAA
jgi:hypothetical protein